jgi:cytochrome c-type biogenesis protein CcmF
LSEWAQGTKVTVGPPFFNKIMIPVGLILLMLTAVGPLLAWRKTSFDSVKRNFTIPMVITVISVVAAMAMGVRPWQSLDKFYAVMTIALSVLVTATIVSEFVRGGRVIAGHTGQNLASAMLYLTGRNTRRYGGYIVHFGVALIMIGFAGAAFNQEKEQEMGYGAKMEIGRYTLVSRSYTQDYNPNYTTDAAIVDVYMGGKFVETMYPEKRTYTSSGQQGTMVANRSTAREDLYLVFAGKNPESNQPIIKAHVNPLVVWIWIGLVVTVFGTGVALTPNRAAVAIRKPAPARVGAAAAQEAGD